MLLRALFEDTFVDIQCNDGGVSERRDALILYLLDSQYTS